MSLPINPTGTATLLELKSLFYEKQQQLWTGTATSGSMNYLLDPVLKDLPSESWPFPVKGKQIRITSGTASGDLRQIAKTDPSIETVYPNRTFSAAITTNTYEIWGPQPHGGVVLTNLFNEAIRDLRVMRWLELTIVTNQSKYQVGTVDVKSRNDIIGVYERILDTTGLRPSTDRPLEWWAEENGETGPKTTLVINPLTLDATHHQLWLAYWMYPSPFTLDSETTDAVYAHWFASEAIVLWARRNMDTSNNDAGAWSATAQLAAETCQQERAKWMPRLPIRIRAVGSLIGKA